MVKENRHITQKIVSHDENSTATMNEETLIHEINWFVKLVNLRLDNYFANGQEHAANKVQAKNGEEIKLNKSDSNPYPILDAPFLGEDKSMYADFVRYYQLDAGERCLLILALLPHIQPQILDVFLTINPKTGRNYTEFGGLVADRQGGFIPTRETALFILAGKDLQARFELKRLFDPEHIFQSHGIFTPSTGAENPYQGLSGSLHLSEEYVDYFTTGQLRKPQFSTHFPAKILRTQMEWGDLIVDEITARQLEEIKTWLRYNQTLLNEWELAARIKPGYKVLFYGPPGTGKTLSAALLGKQFQLDVYRIDLSMVVSKYIGETEKNLEKVFLKAENKQWILFFDEADALFGKRTQVQDAHDRYANQEVSYLLQRLEEYPGLVILASNMKGNVDDAFTRRLQSVIHFKKPQARERFALWKSSFSKHAEIPDDSILSKIAAQYEITGGQIINVVQFTSLQALKKNTNRISEEDIIAGIKREYTKEGKTI